MEVTLTPFQDELDKIERDGPKPTFTGWDVQFSIREPNPVIVSSQPLDTLYTPEEEKEKIFRPLKLVNLDFQCDYEMNMADVIVLRVVLPLGLWAKIIYPYRNYLKVTLVKEILDEKEKQPDLDEAKQSDVYTAIPMAGPELIVEGRDIDHIPRFDLDIKGTVEVNFQLFEQSIEVLRSVTVGGIFRRTTPEKVIKAVLSKEAENNPLDDGPCLDIIDMVPASLQEEREHILLPQGLPYMQVPMHVHRNCGGVYNSGLGTYLKNKDLYVYPLYDTGRFDKVERTLTVFKIPQGRSNGIERTYRVEGERLYVAATSDSAFDDRTESNYMNSGNGVKFADARIFMDSLVETKDNKAIANRKRLNSEYVAHERPGRNNVQSSRQHINSNAMYEYSKMAQKKGSVYMFEWENSDGSLLYPGMPCKILYYKHEEVYELHGVLLKSHSALQLRGLAVTADTYRNNTTLFIFANTPPQEGP